MNEPYNCGRRRLEAALREFLECIRRACHSAAPGGDALDWPSVASAHLAVGLLGYLSCLFGSSTLLARGAW